MGVHQGYSPRPAEKKQALPRPAKVSGAQRGKTDCRLH